MRGKLVVEPGISTRSPFGMELPEAVDVVTAAFDDEKRAELLADVEDDAQESFGSQFLGASYDAIHNEFVVHVDSVGSLDTQTAETALNANLGSGNASAEVVVVQVEAGSDARGGQRADGTGGSGEQCTTAFGIYVSGHADYLTAGHCSGTTWTINGNAATSVFGRQVDTYRDRLAV